MQRFFHHPTVIVLSGVALSACGGQALAPSNGLPRELTASEQRLITSTNQFALSFFREVIRHEHPDSNVFVSPLSAAMALGMTYNGARGETQTAMAQTLGLDQLSTDAADASFRSLIDLLRGLDPLVDFRLANSIWMRQGFAARPAFLDVNRTYFDAQITSLDFDSPAAVGTINGWVNDNTSGKIPTIISAIDPATVMLLINAIYFKGTWVYEFDKSLTGPEPFTLRGGTTRNVAMMHHPGAVDVGRYRAADFEVVDLPYGGGAYSMTILLPAPGRDVDSLAAELSPEAWSAVIAGLSMDSTIVALPKFRLDWDSTLNDVLTALGMGIAFTGNADLSGIAGNPGDLLISYVKQATFVDVNEEGTEAAAATVVGIDVTSVGPSRDFRVERPFLFLIRERFSGTILFMGRIMNPRVD